MWHMHEHFLSVGACLGHYGNIIIRQAAAFDLFHPFLYVANKIIFTHEHCKEMEYHNYLGEQAPVDLFCLW